MGGEIWNLYVLTGEELRQSIVPLRVEYRERLLKITFGD